MNRVIEVSDLSKVYKIYNNKIDVLKESLNPFKKTKYHTEHYALQNINISINKGDTVGIIGKNGSGKSTLLKIITGVLSPTKGKVIVNGKVSALLELGAGFNPEYTGMENIIFNGMMMGYTKEEINNRVQEIVDFSELGNFIYQPVKNYSSGMYARLAFAVAINVEPDILIVDEALSVGDIYFQAKCMTKMKELFSKGITVIYVSHDINSIKALCEKTLYLEYGNQIMFGPSEEVVDCFAKKAREEMIKESYKIKADEIGEVFNLDHIKAKKVNFKESQEFHDRVQQFRQGTGDVILCEIEVLDGEGNPLKIAKFNELIKIRMFVKFNKQARVSVGYHIRDNKNIEIIGSNTMLEDIGELIGEENDKIIVEFSTRLPLVEGLYNVSTVISTMKIHNRSAVFADYTENAYIFSVSENKKSKIWNKVYINNEIKIEKILKEE